MDTTLPVAREMWTLYEPLHAVTYFAPAGRAAFEEAGLRGFWRGYFAGRAAPLGPAGAAVVCASFYNFAPAMVARAMPGVWELITPGAALQSRLTGAAGALRELLAGQEQAAGRAAELLEQVTGTLDCAGRVLAAANASLPAPGDALARLWQAATVLREHRGDGHFAALLAAGIDGCEAVVLRCAQDLQRGDMQPIRGWTDEQWEAAAGRLAGRGLIGADGTLTAAGHQARRAVEEATDRAAAAPWHAAGPEVAAELRELLPPLATPCARLLPSPSPMGLPRPASS